MQDFLAFRKMITPVIIQVLFWLGVVLCVLAGLGGVFGGVSADSVSQVLLGLLILIAGPVLVRVYCELLILAFRMYESMVQIEKNTGGRAE